MSKIILTGGTGMIGTHLCKMLLERNDEVIIFTTQKVVARKMPQVQYVYWNPKEHAIDPSFSIEHCKIVNLAGAGVAAQRWTASRKKEILESRVDSLQTLYKAVASQQIKADCLVSASAIGYYAINDKLLTEDDVADNSFLSSTCVQWEDEAKKFKLLDIPTAIARVGIVLSKEGGALKEFLNLLSFGIAGIPGNGNQVLSWVHIEDICRLFLYLTDAKSIEVYNAVADNPVSTTKLFDAILKIKMGVKIHIPKFLLNIILGEMSIEILKSAEVSNQKICTDGFQFKYKCIEDALENLLVKK